MKLLRTDVKLMSSNYVLDFYVHGKIKTLLKIFFYTFVSLGGLSYFFSCSEKKAREVVTEDELSLILLTSIKLRPIKVTVPLDTLLGDCIKAETG